MHNDDYIQKRSAIGIYAVSTTQGGSVDYLVLNFTWSCPGPATDMGEFDSDAMIFLILCATPLIRPAPPWPTRT